MAGIDTNAVEQNSLNYTVRILLIKIHFKLGGCFFYCRKK